MINELENLACFAVHSKLDKKCKKKNCRYWHNIPSCNNCIINKSNNSPHTLQEIGELFDITRMRVCQIEKSVMVKIKKNIKSNL